MRILCTDCLTADYRHSVKPSVPITRDCEYVCVLRNLITRGSAELEGLSGSDALASLSSGPVPQTF